MFGLSLLCTDAACGSVTKSPVEECSIAAAPLQKAVTAVPTLPRLPDQTSFQQYIVSQEVKIAASRAFKRQSSGSPSYNSFQLCAVE